MTIAVFHALKLAKLLSGRLRDDELVTVQESEDKPRPTEQESPEGANTPTAPKS